MKSHELFRSLLQESNAKELAAALNLSASSIYKWTEPCPLHGGSGSLNPLDRIQQLLEVTGDARLAQWVCNQAGGFFVKNPASGSSSASQSVMEATNKIVQEFADMLSMVAEAAHDNSVSSEEAAKIRERWQELKTATEEFVNCCENGNLEPLRKRD
jgi:hypothetical protein